VKNGIHNVAHLDAIRTNAKSTYLTHNEILKHVTHYARSLTLQSGRRVGAVVQVSKEAGF